MKKIIIVMLSGFFLLAAWSVQAGQGQTGDNKTFNFTGTLRALSAR